MSVNQVGRKLQIVQVGKGFELNCSGDIEVQLYFCGSKALTQGQSLMIFLAKICSVNSEPPDNDLCSSCHFSTFPWSMNYPNTIYTE